MTIHMMVVCKDRDTARKAYEDMLTYLGKFKDDGQLTKIGRLDDQMVLRIGETQDYRIRFIGKDDAKFLDRSFSLDTVERRSSLTKWKKIYKETVEWVIKQDSARLGWQNNDPNMISVAYLYSDGYKDPMQDLINEISPENYGNPEVNIFQRSPVWIIGDKVIITPVHVRLTQQLLSSKFSGVMITTKTVVEHREKLKNELLNLIAVAKIKNI